MTLPKTFAAIIGSTAALALLPAMAASTKASDVQKIEISTKGYDLSKTADAQIVLYKISKAAKRVCGDTNVRQPLNQRATVQECYEDAVERAVASIDAPALSLAMIDRFGQS